MGGSSSLADTGAPPSSGGNLSKSVASVNIAGIAAADTQQCHMITVKVDFGAGLYRLADITGRWQQRGRVHCLGRLIGKTSQSALRRGV